MDVKPGTRVRNSYGDGIILAPDDCEVINKYSHRSQKWRDGYINGWPDMSYLSYIATPQEKVEAARKALAEAEAELAASIAPKAGDRYYSPLNGTTATVKFVDGDVVYYEFVSNNYTSYFGRKIESFLKAYETKLCDC